MLREYAAVVDRNMPNYGGDYGLYVRKQNLANLAGWTLGA